jgi:hypothetical protein
MLESATITVREDVITTSFNVQEQVLDVTIVEGEPSEDITADVINTALGYTPADSVDVQTPVPANAVFTDTVYDDTAIQAEVTANTTDRHTHANKSIIDKFGENAQGEPTYNGVKVDTTIAQRDVYDGLDSIDNTISLSANQGKVLNDKIGDIDTALDTINGQII